MGSKERTWDVAGVGHDGARVGEVSDQLFKSIFFLTVAQISANYSYRFVISEMCLVLMKNLRKAASSCQYWPSLMSFDNVAANLVKSFSSRYIWPDIRTTRPSSGRGKIIA